MKGTILVLFGVLVTSMAFADYVLDDFDGKVELKVASGWKTLDTGAKVPADATVRISGNGLAEFVDAGVRLHLSKDGTYVLATVASKAKSAPSANLLSLTGDKVGVLLGTKAASGVPVANMGARGAQVDPSAGIQWSEDDSATAAPQDPIPAIEELVKAAQYNKALVQVDLAMSDPAADVPVLRLEKARILALLGRSASALREAQAARIQRAEAHYLEAVLLISSQALAVQDYDLVVQTTTQGLVGQQNAEVVQNLTLLQALGYRGQGQEKTAQDLLKKVAASDPNSPTGQEATRQLKG